MKPLTEPTRVEGYEAVRLRSPSDDVDATFVPSAGMVGASLRDHGAELLHRNGGVHRYARGGSTMGIPLLHPWANRLAGDAYRVNDTAVRLDPASPLVQRDEHGLPIHGLLNGFPHWRTVEPDEGWALAAEVDFVEHPELLAGFPFPHRLRLDVALRRRRVTVRTTLTATGDRPVPVAFGFHPYLRLPGVERSAWRLELPARRHLFADARGIPTGDHEAEDATRLTLNGRSFDDGFDRIADGATFGVAGGGRRVTVTFVTGYPAAQVFAPRGGQFVCFEPMTAPTNVLRSGDGLRRVAPGADFTAVFTIGVEAR